LKACGSKKALEASANYPNGGTQRSARSSETTIRKQTFLVCELRVLVNSAILKNLLGRTGTNMQTIYEAVNKVRANQSFKSAHFVRPTTNRSLCSRLVAA